jgi:MoxR-like ATPase
MQQRTDVEAITRLVQAESAFLPRLTEATAKVIVGQETMMDRLLIGLLTKGHILLEGMPGLAKTLAIKTLSQWMRNSVVSSSRPTCCPPT